MLAQRVAELVRGGGARAGEVAVLLRALGDLEVYERALQLRGLRTLAAVGGFWGHQQVGDLLAYLRALANPLDELALYGDARLAAGRALARRPRAARARRAGARGGRACRRRSPPRGEERPSALAERGPRSRCARSASACRSERAARLACARSPS